MIFGPAMDSNTRYPYDIMSNLGRILENESTEPISLFKNVTLTQV